MKEAWLALFHNPILDAEIIKIRVPAHLLCRVVEQTKTIPHKMRQSVRHLQLLTDRLPGLAIQAVEKIGYILFVLEIAFGFEKNLFAAEGNGSCFHRFARSGVDHHNFLLTIDDFYTYRAIVFLQKAQTCKIPLFQFGNIQCRSTRAFRSNGALSQGVSGQEE